MNNDIYLTLTQLSHRDWPDSLLHQASRKPFKDAETCQLSFYIENVPKVRVRCLSFQTSFAYRGNRARWKLH